MMSLFSNTIIGGQLESHLKDSICNIQHMKRLFPEQKSAYSNKYF
jgi:hypothetical protein